MSDAKTTPLMKQYFEIKSLYPEPILLYRMGDFFEMFFEDAVKASALLGLTLTQRNKKSGDETPMCGVPHHSIAGPINRLLAAGHKVAICDQLEDPKLAKGLVKRGVTRVLTPGMVYDPDSLEAQKPNYLVSYDETCLAAVETTTGESFFFQGVLAGDLRRLLELLPVAELVLASQQAVENLPPGLVLSRHEDLAEVSERFFLGPAPTPARRLLSYVRQMSGDAAVAILRPFEERALQGRLEMAASVIRHLEIFETYKGQGEGSLFTAVNRTKTSAGARLLRQWLSFPLRHRGDIEARYNQIDLWRSDLARLKRVREMLGRMGDLERRLSKLPHSTCGGRDLLSLAASLSAGLSALEMAETQGNSREKLGRLCAEIESVIVEEPPLSPRQGGVIRRGVQPDLDELMDLTTDAQGLLARLELREKESTGISSLKVRYNSVFGYYIEVTNSHKDKVPAHYQRKQTLTNAERFCTEELLELERKVLTAQTRRADLEWEIFDSLRRKILAQSSEIMALASACAQLDVLSSWAWLSLEQNYVRPRLMESQSLRLVASRHPVVEQTLKAEFVANDLSFGPRECMILTGPNMAGKSTLMRQVALAALLAQAGCFVPAREAELPIFESLHTRIGASDQLSEGLSTFMVEMTETASLLRSAGPRSLVILDEVGRGTSTYDGMCLAQSILEYLLSHVGSLTLFATHYHELTRLEAHWPQVRNAHMSVVDRGGEIRFLHTLSVGPATKSYGIQVAELAGLPQEITRRAKALLKGIENPLREGPSFEAQMSLLDSPPAALESTSQTEDEKRKAEALNLLIQEIRGLSISQTTPLEALQKVARWQESCRDLS